MFWQISPPTAPIPTEQLRDFKSGLDEAWQAATGTVAPELLALGNDLWAGMAVIVVVWTGLRIAFSGDIQPWDFVRLIIGLWIPWVILQFYNQPIPGMAMSFPVMIAAGGTWVQAFFIGDIAYDMQTAMGNLVDTLGVSVQTAYEEGGVWDLVLSGGHAALSLIGGTLIIVLVVISLLILFAITYAQVIWAQLAVAILILLGPIFIPWLVFDPLAFLFWGWFKGLLTYSIYGVIAAAVMRVFTDVSLSFIARLAITPINWSSLSDTGLWVLAVIPLAVAGILAALQVGTVASMLVTGGGAAGSGLMGAIGAASSASKGATKAATKGAV